MKKFLSVTSGLLCMNSHTKTDMGFLIHKYMSTTFDLNIWYARANPIIMDEMQKYIFLLRISLMI